MARPTHATNAHMNFLDELVFTGRYRVASAAGKLQAEDSTLSKAEAQEVVDYWLEIAPTRMGDTWEIVATVDPAVTGTEEVGETLTCDNGTWDGSPTTYTKQWYVGDEADGSDGEAIEGETAGTYVVLEADVERFIHCKVIASKSADLDDFSAPTMSNVTAAIGWPVENTVAPALSGTEQVGETLTVTDGTWTGEPDTFVYAWYVGDAANGSDGVVIAGETANTYLLDAADEGRYVHAKVTASSPYDTSDPEMSDVTAAILAA